VSPAGGAKVFSVVMVSDCRRVDSGPVGNH
jgi:hypothetical protein